MEDSYILLKLFNQTGCKNIIIGETETIRENYIKKIGSLFNKETTKKIQIGKLNILENIYIGYYPAIFICCTSLSEFLNEIKSIDNEDIDLKKFNITFLCPQKVDLNILKKFGKIMAVKKRKYVYPFEVEYISKSPLKKSEMEIYLKTKEMKTKIFEIRKYRNNISKKKKKTKSKKINIKNNKLIKKDNSIDTIKNSDLIQNPNSLISISSEVMNYLMHKEKTSSSELTNYIVDLLSKKSGQLKMSFKNIQRRVYDAINVINSLGLIKKENFNMISTIKTPENISMNINKDIITIKNKVEENKNILIQKLIEYNTYKIMINRNKSEIRYSTDKLEFPFHFISGDGHIDINTDKSKKSLVLMSDKKLNFLGFNDIAKRICFDNLQDIYTTAEELCGTQFKNYLLNNNLINTYFSDLINEKEKLKDNLFNNTNTKIFDCDFNFSCINDNKDKHCFINDNYTDDNNLNLYNEINNEFKYYP